MKRFLISLAGSSVLWGLVATFGFYYALNQGYLDNDAVRRYAAGHPVEYVTVGMFFIGLCDLAFKFLKARRDRRALRRGTLFPPKSAEKEPLAKVKEYLGAVDKARDVRGDSAYLSRLRSALEYLKLGGAPDELDLELRRLADDAYDERDADYGMVGAFIWAIPILGFLGTVLGITVALGSLDLTQIETTSEKLAGGLKVAFDTTALALGLVFVLYFVKFVVRRQDAAIEKGVAKLVDRELKGRFYDENAGGDASTAELSFAVDPNSFEPVAKLLAQTLAATLEDHARRQTETLVITTRGLADEFGRALDRRFEEGSGSWLRALADAQSRFVEESVRPSLEELSKRSERFDSLEDKVAQETEALRQTLRACADVAAIEDRLAASLKELAQVNAFEKTLSNLNAAVCLLNSRLAAPLSTPNLDKARRAAKRSETLAALQTLDEKPTPIDGATDGSEPYPLKPEVANELAASNDPAPTPNVYPFAEPHDDVLTASFPEAASLDATESSPEKSSRLREALGKKRRSA